jgi:hypothetical protein
MVTMKALILAAVVVLVPMAFGQNGARPFLLVDVSGNPFPSGSGTALPYTPPSFICYTTSGGSILPCNFAAGGGDTITSPNGTLTVGGTATATTLDFNLAHANTWVGTQTFGTAAGGFSLFSVYSTSTNCASSTGTCAAAAAGSVAVAAGTNPTLTVTTTRVTANSQIMLMPDQSLGTRLAVTCNTTIPTNQTVTARTSGTSFTFEAVGTFTTNPVCYSYTIVN